MSGGTISSPRFAGVKNGSLWPGPAIPQDLIAQEQKMTVRSLFLIGAACGLKRERASGTPGAVKKWPAFSKTRQASDQPGDDAWL
jgi:hypothetical protein